MLTTEQIAALNAAANGTLVIQSANPNADAANQNVIINPYPGCNQAGAPGKTDFSVPIDPSKFNTDQCGLVSFYIDMTGGTADAPDAATFVWGGLIGPGDEQIATDIYGFPSSTSLLASLDQDDVVGVDGANFNPTLLFPWIQDVFNGKNFIFSSVNIERTAGSTDLSTLGKFRKYSLSPEGDWEVSNPKLQQNFCSPCFQDDDGSHVQYNGFLPVTGTDAIALDIPSGIAITMEFCVFSYENSKNMTQCSA